MSSKLPLSLPQSLNPADLSESVPKTVTQEIYDPWQGKSLSGIDSNRFSSISGLSVDDASPGLGSEEEVDIEGLLENETISEDEKQLQLQKLLMSAASQGYVDIVRDILGGKASHYVNIDKKDESGKTALVYASCFGHEDIVVELLRYGAQVDLPDQTSEWTPLMWAINNNHLGVVERLMENGADPTIKTSTGRSALDSISPYSEIYVYMTSHGYMNSNQADFYDDGGISTRGFGGEEPDQLMMESAYNLDVKMAHLQMDDDDDDDIGGFNSGMDGLDDDQEFLWDRCLPDQMFVFNESDIPRILDFGISQMEPKRSPSQKPIPANLLFLCARYAHYFGSPDVLENLLSPAFQRIRKVVMEKKEDIAFMSFWLSNCTLLLYYLRKDAGLISASITQQEALSEIITDITVLISQDVERRLDLVLDSSILDYQTIPGLDEIRYQSEWRIFKSRKKPKSHKEEMDEILQPPSPKKKMLPSPRNVTSILSSVLFVTDLYEVHPIIVQQLMSQIFYWIGCVVFNKIMDNRKYLARSRAMQIRLNISAIEDWARANNRTPEVNDEFHNRNISNYPSIIELCRKHFTPLVEILQWLQCFTAIGNDLATVTATLQQLTALNSAQLLHVANKYRAEVGEKGLSKEYKTYLSQLNLHYTRDQNYSAIITKTTIHDVLNPRPKEQEQSTNKEPVVNDEVPKILPNDAENSPAATHISPKPETEDPEPEADSISHADSVVPVAPSQSVVPAPPDEDLPDTLYLDASAVLPFVIPTLTEMIITWGAGLGGTHKQRAKKYEPNLPVEFLDKLEDELGQAGEGLGVNPIFGQNLVEPPKPSVHKTWGDDPAMEELERDEYGSVW